MIDSFKQSVDVNSVSLDVSMKGVEVEQDLIAVAAEDSTLVLEEISTESIELATNLTSTEEITILNNNNEIPAIDSFSQTSTNPERTQESEQQQAEDSLEEFTKLYAQHQQKLLELGKMKAQYQQQKLEFESSLNHLVTLQGTLDELEKNTLDKKDAIMGSIQKSMQIADTIPEFFSHGGELDSIERTEENRKVLHEKENSNRNKRRVSFDSKVIDESFIFEIDNGDKQMELESEDSKDDSEENLRQLEKSLNYEKQVKQELAYLQQLKSDLEQKKEKLKRAYDENMDSILCANQPYDEDDNFATNEVKTTDQDIFELMQQLRSVSVINGADETDHAESRVVDEEKEANFEIIPTPEVNSANLINMDIQDEHQLAQNEELIDNWMEKIMNQILELDEFCHNEQISRPELSELRVRLTENLGDLSELKDKIEYFKQIIKTGRVPSTDEIREDTPVQWIENQRVYEIPVEDEIYTEESTKGDEKNYKFAQIETTREEQDSYLIENDIETMDAREKQLFNRYKEEIYKGAASIISEHEKEPYFLIQLFRGVAKLDSSYLRQRFLLALDDVMVERKNDL